MKIVIDGHLVEQVSEFRYLSSLISENRYCEKEIRNRIAIGKKIFMDKKRLFTSHFFTGKLNLELKKRIIFTSLQCSTVCATETWMLMRADRIKY